MSQPTAIVPLTDAVTGQRWPLVVPAEHAHQALADRVIVLHHEDRGSHRTTVAASPPRQNRPQKD
jgi:hypothetical protein